MGFGQRNGNGNGTPATMAPTATSAAPPPAPAQQTLAGAPAGDPTDFPFGHNAGPAPANNDGNSDGNAPTADQDGVAGPATPAPATSTTPPSQGGALAVRSPTTPETTALAAYGGADLAAVLGAQGINPDQLCGLMNLNDADRHLGAGIPVRQIEQPTTAEANGLIKGHITNRATKDQQETIEAVLLATKFCRGMWPKFDPNNPAEALCASRDGITCSSGTRAETEGWVGKRACAACPLKDWGPKQANGRSAAPECSENFVTLMIDRKDGQPFLFRFKRTGIKPLRDLRNQINAKALRNMAAGLPPAIAQFAVGFTMESEFIRKDKTSYYIPKFGGWVTMPNTAVGEYVAICKAVLPQFLDVDVGTFADTEEDAETHANNNANGRNANVAPEVPFDDEPPHPGNRAAAAPPAQQAAAAPGNGRRPRW